MDKKILLQDFKWDDIEEMTLSLIPHLKSKGFDYVVGVNRGGLVPAVIISHKIEAQVLSISKNDNPFTVFSKPGRYLIVDEIFDTGETLKSLNVKVSNFNDSFYLPGQLQVEYAVLLCNTDVPEHKLINYSAIEFSRQINTQWFKFPWE